MQDTDAIVNAANNHFWMGAIKRKGGSQIETNAVSQSPVEIGGAVITTGGTLNANHVIHAADTGQDQRTDLDKVGAATRSTLALAHELTSLAFPAIRTGGGGLSLEICAKAMIDVVVDLLTSNKTALERVRCVLFDPDGYDAFQSQL